MSIKSVAREFSDHYKMQKSVYRVRNQVSLVGRIALDMIRESRAENRARTTRTLQQAHRGSS
jgi:hypothetical protein